MRAVLIYAGTTEGRTLAFKLAEKGIPSEVCVATEYGRQVMQGIDKKNSKDLIKVRQGRLLPEQMRSLLEEGDYLAVVDCTHPYATLVTENIRKSIAGMEIPYYRLERDLKENVDLEKITMKRLCHFYATAKECAQKLSEGEGTILLTTGSKELELFCEDEELRRRLVVRVLPGKESMELCWKCGLEGKQIIAMQGPFTKEMNLATIRQYGVAALVTKESGKIGGVDEKLEAALEAEIDCHVIRKPAQESERAYSYEEVCQELFRLAGKATDVKEEKNVVAFSKDGKQEKKAGKTVANDKEEGRLDIVLAGIGMGSEGYRTQQLDKRLAETDYLFGAKRMVDGIKFSGKTYPYYLERDIIPCLKRIQKDAEGVVKATILFSGDSGFYSGAEKLIKALKELENAKVDIYPGISSVSALCAKFGVSWQDAMIMSTHGTEKNAWKTEMLYGLRRGRKIFFLTSGPEDVREIGALLEEYGFDDQYEIKLGYQLSYENERTYVLSAGDAKKTEAAGLYAGLLIKRDEEKQDLKDRKKQAGEESLLTRLCFVTPGFEDEAFLRDKVPMTKEEVREISLCKLHLTEDAVVYDVGSGTGSIAMEIAALSPKIKVFAIECKKEAVELIEKNRKRFGAMNVTVCEALAPEGMRSLPVPSHVFIGGSKGNLKEILDEIYEKNPKARVVINAISLETIAQVQGLLKEYSLKDLEITNVAISKAKEVGEYHLMQAANPVMIYAFTFTEKK